MISHSLTWKTASVNIKTKENNERVFRAKQKSRQAVAKNFYGTIFFVFALTNSEIFEF